MQAFDFEGYIYSILEGEKRENSFLSLSFISDQEMQNINRDYRGKDKTTNVLSFAYEDNEFPTFEKNILGEVLVSFDKVKKDTNISGRTNLEETIFVVTHGVLHLLGYDHNSDEEENEMVSKESEYISSSKKYNNI